MPLIHLIYASTSSTCATPAELAAILATSRRNNTRDGVTGMLLHTGGSFFQVLEGEAAAVDAAFARIAGDERHRDVVTIIRERIHQRAFGEWSMGFAEMDRETLESLTGANDFFSDGTALDALGPGRAKKILMAFRKNRWRLSETAPAGSR